MLIKQIGGLFNTTVRNYGKQNAFSVDKNGRVPKVSAIFKNMKVVNTH